MFSSSLPSPSLPKSSYITTIVDFICIWYTTFLSFISKPSAEPTKEIQYVPLIVDPSVDYVTRRTSWFIHKYDDNKKNKNIKSKLNSNIDAAFYDKKTFYEILANELNDIEKKWKINVLYEPTPRGNIFMHYDVYKQGFAYYSDQQTIPYSILNAVAMKYCITFLCCDFFMDEKTMMDAVSNDETSATKELGINNESQPVISVTWMTPLAKVFFEDEVPSANETMKENTDNRNNIKTMLKNAPFAKLKNYKMMDSTPKTKDGDNTNKKIESVSSNKPPPIPLKNKFIYLGKVVNYQIFKPQISLQPQAKLMNTTKSMYSDLFSESTPTPDPTTNTNVNTSNKTAKISWKEYKNKNKNVANNIIQ